MFSLFCFFPIKQTGKIKFSFVPLDSWFLGVPTILFPFTTNISEGFTPQRFETAIDFNRMHIKVSKAKLSRRVESLKQKLPGLGVSLLRQCYGGCSGRGGHFSGGSGTRIWNLSDRPVELQIRVGSILKRVHTLKPGSSKRLKCNNIYRAYMPNSNSLLYYYDESCHPYIWVHDTGADFSRMVKQQYISLEDLRDCSDIRIFRDRQRGCVAVQKRARAGLC